MLKLEAWRTSDLLLGPLRFNDLYRSGGDLSSFSMENRAEPVLNRPLAVEIMPYTPPDSTSQAMKGGLEEDLLALVTEEKL